MTDRTDVQTKMDTAYAPLATCDSPASQLHDIESAASFRSIFEYSYDAILMTIPDGQILSANPAACRMFGMSEAEICQAGRAGLVDMAYPPLQEAIEQRRKNGEFRGVLRYIRKDGSRFLGDATSKIFRNEAGELRTVMIIRDDNERQKAQALLQESQEKALALVHQLKEADHNKNRFISILSHELRNPLATITMGLALMDRATHEIQQKQARDMLDRQIAQLTQLVDDLLDVSRIGEHKIRLKKEWLNLGHVLQGILSDCQSRFDDQGITLIQDLPAHPVCLMADCLRLTQVLENLLHNALKFTPRQGQVRVTARFDESNTQVCIQVADTGMGIEADMLPHLFQPFFQIEKDGGRRHSGLGLGLSIVKALVELHDGCIALESKGAGQGTTFTIHLPIGNP